MSTDVVGASHLEPTELTAPLLAGPDSLYSVGHVPAPWTSRGKILLLHRQAGRLAVVLGLIMSERTGSSALSNASPSPTRAIIRHDGGHTPITD
jgi:hypothetical protein